MKQFAFKMKIREGTAAEYKRRHDEIWPEIKELLSSSGISDYTIFLDEESHDLFAVRRQAEGHTADGLQDKEIVKKWCDYMADIVVMDSAGDPVCKPLSEMFHMD